MIYPADIIGVEDGDARRVLVYARSIAPCLDSLEGENRLDAIAILTGVAREVAARGSRLVQSQRIGSAAVAYVDVKSCFGTDDRSALRGLCGAVDDPGLPVGSFPASSPTASVWPEGPYT